MPFLNFRYIMFVTLLISAMVLAFYAGEKEFSVSEKEKAHSPKLFRSFRFLKTEKTEKKESVTTNLNTEKSEVVPPLKKNPEEKKKEEELKNIQKEPAPSSSIDTPKMSENTPKISENFYVSHPETRTIYFPVIDKRAKSRNVPEEKPLRKKTFPSISDVYVPVYKSENLTSKTLESFSTKFRSVNPQTNLYILREEIASSENGTKYEILIFDSQGRHFLGSFQTAESRQFPFSGVPSFEKAQPELYKEISRFLVFSSSPEEFLPILSDESHLESIFKTAYRISLISSASSKNETFLGTDSQTGLSLYSIFPGIYLAGRLR